MAKILKLDHMLLVGAVILTVLFASAMAFLLVSGGSPKPTVAQIVDQASEASIVPPAGNVLYVKTDIYRRYKPDADQAPAEGPEGDRPSLYSLIPERRIFEVWMEIADSGGLVSQRYGILTDQSGQVIQEELYDGDAEFLHEAFLNRVIKFPDQEPPKAGVTINIDELLAADNAELIGEGSLAGESVYIIEVRRVPTPGELKQEGDYVSPYYADLAPVELVSRYQIAKDFYFPSGRELFAVQADGSRHLVSHNLKVEISTMPASQLPDDFFSLKHAAGADVVEAKR